MNRLGLIWFQDIFEIEFEIENKLWKSIKEVTSKIIVLCENDLVHSFCTENRIDAICVSDSNDYMIYEKIIQKMEEKELFQNFDEIIFTNNYLVGPFHTLSYVLEKMNPIEADFWGLVRYASMFTSDKKTIPAYVDSDFLVLRSSIYEKLLSLELKERLKENWNKGFTKDVIFTYSLEQLGCVGKGYCDTQEYVNVRNCNNFNYFFGKSYELVKEKGCPYVPCDIFTQKNLKADNGNDARKLMEYICKQSEDISEYFWHKLLKFQDISDIYRGLHLDYVLSKYNFNRREKIENTAIIIHVYYFDVLNSLIQYIRNIPREIDLYITTSVNENISAIHQIFTDNHIENYQILKVKNRGRDCSALLVGCKNIIRKYKYICFLHDKKTSGNNGACTIGEVFMESLFDNLIGSESYIYNIYQLLENNSLLGVVAPPIPVHGQYFCLKENAWTCCFDKTVELAKKLELTSKMRYEKSPFILSTSFWCRTEALKPLWDYSFSYDDFVEEPMPEDGTISHAIERILPYVAQHQGFYSGVVMNEKYASLQLSNLAYQLVGTVNAVKREHSISTYESFENFDFLKFEEFCHKYKRLYIYGAGLYGEKYAQILKNKGIDFEGYIVTRKSSKDNLNGYPIYLFKEFKEREEDNIDKVGIIVAVSIYYQEEIRDLLEEEDINNYYIV